MIRAVIFDMYETLITHYRIPPYFSKEMAEDAGIPIDKFQAIWHGTEDDRTIGKLTFEEVIEMILMENKCYSEELFKKIIEKRLTNKEECFRHLHTDIIPMLKMLKEKGLLIGLISNCYSEEKFVIRRSILMPFFDSANLSCELGLQKPDKRIFQRCIEELSVDAEECIYVGDGGSYELETARDLGMKAVQAVWYLQEGISPSQRKDNFMQLENPIDLMKLL